MRICLYTETALPMLGGQELVVDALARQFLARGHEAVVLAPQPRSPLVADDASFPYRVVRHPRFISTRHFVAEYRWFLHRLHRSFPFDVLHCHSVYPAGYLGVLARDRLRVPVVITSHGGDLAETSRLLRKPGLPERYVHALRGADALVSISPFTRAGFARLAPGIPVQEIPNGVDAAAFAAPAPRPPDLPAGITPRGFILFLGRLSRRKGVDLLLDALAALPASERPLTLLAGGGEERDALMQQSASLGLGDGVRFLGPVGGATKIWLLQNAIATVMPSRDWEAFPLVVLEAAAAGSPLVATDIPGLRDLVAHGRTGWLVEGTPQAFGRALREAAADRLVAEQMGAAARKHAETHDWSLVAARYLDVFEQVAGGETPRARQARL